MTWETTLDRAHPLVGRIWDTRKGAFIDETTLARDLAGATYVLLGEKHDNPDHHRLQARALRSLTSAGRRPAVAFEMFDVDEQPAIDRARAEHPHDGDAIAAAVGWDHKGWPAWPSYGQIVAIALTADLPIVAANPPRAETRALVHEGLKALPPETVHRLGLDRPMPEPLADSLREELRASHCGHLPEAMTEPMLLAQRAKDAEMAERMQLAGKGEGSVLIAGTGHTRTDRGVPPILLAKDPKANVRSLAFVEVESGKDAPPAYADRWHAATLPFDYVWFTPRASDEDPCAAFNKK